MTIPELVSQHFIKIQVVVFCVGLFFSLRFFRSNQEESRFKVREADRKDLDRLKQGPDLAQAKFARKPNSQPPPPPLSLPGIRLAGAPHEILGVEETATEAQVMRAYKDAIKRFHPDRIQGQAKEQIQFYQEASAKLNQAKEEMLKIIRLDKTQPD
jgi:DnaJ-domain-containing protein 1